MATFNQEVFTQPKILKVLKAIADETIPEEEEVLIALKGAFKEYLFCTAKNVYIVKKGFMTGHTFGNGDFKMPYKNITNVEVDYTFGGGYFEVSSGGMQNTKKNYWSTDDSTNPAKQPNCVAINDKTSRDLFKKASSIILDKVAESHENTQPSDSTIVSAADELLKFKQLLDLEVITQEEFDKKKAEILNS